MKKRGGFTLIELMVVVAIIAILATLSVSNFSTATRRTRNSQRVSDMETVAKAMETCYDMASGQYKLGTANLTSVGWTNFASTASAPALFNKSNNTCLNQDIKPAVNGYNYYYTTIAQAAGTPGGFAICAELERVNGWESVGNSQTANFTRGAATTNFKWTLGTACTSSSNKCYFCVTNQQ